MPPTEFWGRTCGGANFWVFWAARRHGRWLRGRMRRLFGLFGHIDPNRRPDHVRLSSDLEPYFPPRHFRTIYSRNFADTVLFALKRKRVCANVQADVKTSLSARAALR
jgi:hypothetical protein